MTRDRTLSWVISIIMASAVMVFGAQLDHGSRAAIAARPIEAFAKSLADCIAAQPDHPRARCQDQAAALSNRLAARYSPADIKPHTGFFNVYVLNNALIYRRPRCTDSDLPARPVVLVIFPVDDASLPEASRPIGKQSLDFNMQDVYFRANGACIALRALPPWPFRRILTGEPGGREYIWVHEIDPVKPPAK